MMIQKKIKYVIAAAALTGALQMSSCDKRETPLYEAGAYLFFNRMEGKTRIDTAEYSFSHFPGQEQISHKFKISLIGDPYSEDRTYRVEVLTGKDADGVPYTTAQKGQFLVPEKPVFRANRISDSLEVTMVKSAIPDGAEVWVTLRIAANENFGIGYYQYTDVKLRVNTKIVKPLWWNDEVSAVIFGTYSYQKLQTIIAANPGFVSVDGMTLAHQTEIGLNTKKYIRENGITEADGSPMIIPIY